MSCSNPAHDGWDDRLEAAEREVEHAYANARRSNERKRAAESALADAEARYQLALSEGNEAIHRARDAERERDELKALCHDADQETMMYVDRAESAESALAEAREALRGTSDTAMRAIG